MTHPDGGPQGGGGDSFALDRQRRLLLDRVLPEYAALGMPVWAHAQGSLGLGFTPPTCRRAASHLQCLAVTSTWGSEDHAIVKFPRLSACVGMSVGHCHELIGAAVAVQEVA